MMEKSFLMSMVCILMLAPPAWGSTLKRESRDECCICHVLWFDSLAKKEKTLLERTDSPIVIAGSAGLSSSQEICYSCHDGYVADSRNAITRNNKHQLIGKVPEGLTLPDIFRLTKDNEFYCGTCHGFHDVRAQGEIGETPFTRMDNERSQMCTACHPEKLTVQGAYAGHPVMEKAEELPTPSVLDRGLKFGPEGEIICQSCHNSHGRRAMNAPVEDSSICLICHENEGRLMGTEHDLRVTMPDEKNVKEESLSESGPCGACHTPHEPAGPKLWAREIEPDGSLSAICLSCHDKSPDDTIKDTGRHSHPVNVDQTANVTRQTSETMTVGGLPLFPKEGETRMAGAVQCFSCHNPHQWDPADPDIRGGKDAEGDASNSFLRISNRSGSALCMECHTDKKQLLSYDHNLSLSAPEAKNIQGFTAAKSGPCGTCHIPHNAEAPRLWAREISREEALRPQYCLGCHRLEGPAKEKLTGENDHPVDVVSEGLNISRPDSVTKVLPLFDAAGGMEAGDRIACLTCHDPHIWSEEGGSPAGEANDVKTPDAAGEGNREGDAVSSFLRKSASPSPELCGVCHEEARLLPGTDHDLLVTAPAAKNLLDQTVQESGPCGACHAIHNSPAELKLWVRSFGPVDEDQHPMNGLCTSCHSEGEAAEDKIPSVATHPEGMLIDNILSYNRQREGYLPIFDADGKEVNVGDISCTSCHSSHHWDYRSMEKGTGRNIEGDATTSFLRTSTRNLVCIDCHGEEAIWRYTYYHSTPKREALSGEQQAP